MAALVYVATSIIQIPSPVNGYVNLGDCFVLLSGWLLGPWWGGAAAGIGSMLVDLLSGYGHYVPGTLIIKGLDALVAALIFRALGRGKTAMLVSGIVGGDTSVSAAQRRRVILMSACSVWLSGSRPVGSKEKSDRSSVCSRCFADRFVI